MATQIVASNIYNFGSASAIRTTISYDKKRDGANMLYKLYYKIEIADRSGNHSSTGYYGYNIASNLYLNGNLVWAFNTYDTSKGWTHEYTSDWITISNKTSGTTPFSFTASSSNFSYSSSNVYLDIDPAGSELKTINNFNIGDTLSINTTKYNSNFYDVLQIKIGTSVIREITGATTENTITFTDDELNSIYNLMLNSVSTTFTFLLNTYADSSKSSLVGTSTKTATGTLTDYLPTISNISYLSTNTESITHDNQVVVSNYSDIQISCTFELNKNATLTKIYLDDGTTFTITDNKATATVNLSSATFKINIQDSRTTNSISYTIPAFINYLDLTLNATFTRNTPVDNKVKIEYSGNFFNSKFGDNGENNTLNVYYRYKKTSESDYSDWISIDTTATNNTYSNEYVTDALIDYRYEYNIEIKATDLIHFDSSAIIITSNTIPKGIPVFNWGEDYFNINGDIQQNGISIFDRFIFDGEEHIIGKWFNKILYRKTISAIVSGNTTNTIDISSLNVENIMLDESYSFIKLENGIFLTIPRINTSDIKNQLEFRTTVSTISLILGNISSISNCYVTILYTKTTD